MALCLSARRDIDGRTSSSRADLGGVAIHDHLSRRGVVLDRRDARASRDDGGGWGRSWRGGIGFGAFVFGWLGEGGEGWWRGEVMRRASLTHPTVWWSLRSGGRRRTR